MQSMATDVDSYLEEVPEKRKAALARLRALCLETLEGYGENMEYKMPSYKRPGGEVEVAFASQTSYISFYVLRKNVLDRFRDQLATANLLTVGLECQAAGSQIGVGCKRFLDGFPETEARRRRSLAAGRYRCKGEEEQQQGCGRTKAEREPHGAPPRARIMAPMG